MELTDIINTPYGFHCLIVGGVVFFALLVFAFGFKSAEEPPFDKLTYGNDDRKPAGKKRKLKDKKGQSNGHATAVGGDIKKAEQKVSSKKDVEKSPSKDMAKSAKDEKKFQALRETKENKTDKKGSHLNKVKGKGKENVELKNKKNQEEKPKDFDDGEWEQALSRKDKMKKKAALEEILPQRSDKKKDLKKKNKSEDEEIGEDFTLKGKESLKVDDEISYIKDKAAVVEALSEMGVTVEMDSKTKKLKNKKLIDEEKEESATPIAEADSKQRSKKQEISQNSLPVAAKLAQPISEVPATESNVAFDELGDTWKEAKVQKKATKKKTRKD